MWLEIESRSTFSGNETMVPRGTKARVSLATFSKQSVQLGRGDNFVWVGVKVLDGGPVSGLVRARWSNVKFTGTNQYQPTLSATLMTHSRRVRPQGNNHHSHHLPPPKHTQKLAGGGGGTQRLDCVISHQSGWSEEGEKCAHVLLKIRWPGW